MANLTAGEQQLFSLFWGKDNLIDNDDFWFHIQSILMPEDKEIVLPLAFNPLTVRRILDMLECSPGICGRCCQYRRVELNELDVKSILEHSPLPEEEVKKHITSEGDKAYLLCDAEQGCPFLKDNACQIYAHRPNACYLFPIQGGIAGLLNGKPFEAMRFRLKCLPALNAARTILRESLNLSDGKAMLLPDLSLVPVFNSEVKSEI